MAAEQCENYNLALDEDEREELLHALEQCATETHDEKRHADSIQYRDHVAGDESRVRTLLERLRRLAQYAPENAPAVIRQAIPGAAEQIAHAASDFEFERTGRLPKSVTVVLGQDTVVITLHGSLSPAERALLQSPTGAAQVQELHRRLFDNSCESLRKEIKRITGVDVSEASIEVEPTTGTVVKAFASGTVVQVFLLSHDMPTESWSGNGSDGRQKSHSA
jgi:uncharacterized protein YbcI